MLGVNEQWSVARVRAGFEVEYAKEVGGMTPLQRHRWPYRGTMMERLMAEFPGYVFFQGDPENPDTWHQFAKSKHWYGYLSGKITKAEMVRLLDGLDENNVRVEKEQPRVTKFNHGDHLLITTGPYTGYTAICDYHRGEKLRAHLTSSGQCLHMRAEWCTTTQDASLNTSK